MLFVVCLVSPQITALAFITMVWVSELEAAPVQWRIEDGGNGHYYELLPEETGLSWEEAKKQAEDEDKVFMGANGYLATITSVEENSFVFDTLLTSETLAFAFLGGSLPTPGGQWQWDNGDPWSYTRWKSGEPTGMPDEDALQMYGKADPNATKSPGYWNDMPKAHEYPDNSAAVVEYLPEPATLSLLVLGGLALVRRRKRGMSK